MGLAITGLEPIRVRGNRVSWVPGRHQVGCGSQVMPPRPKMLVDVLVDVLAKGLLKAFKRPLKAV